MSPVSAPRPLARGDDRNRFDCGHHALNEWFRRHAWNNQATGASRVTVIEDDVSGRIVGYVTLSSAQIERAFLPRAHQRNQPDPIPVTLLGQLAVDRDWQSQGHAISLLLFALTTALKASEHVGSTAVIAHPLNETIRGFYARWGFFDLPFDPRGAMIARMADIRRRLQARA
ncbi:acetyltransferase (GNAT) family protein [Roseiarcus fermentans]|uniref:Acetyltransferase (GNAT) family protein n=1 Tax=Roseiarcus fermentans TaxID=1473586 RepID=A0A366FLP7_9HYPH|nr:GNAT family N-acetyltransferase [Roseiarcus fermentans]RBP15501.1 acetyltransferase (GNAT) family protein [Roseiarcus fermentans]